MRGRKATVADRLLVRVPAMATKRAMAVVAKRAIVRIFQAQRVDLDHHRADAAAVRGAASGVACAAAGLGRRRQTV